MTRDPHMDNGFENGQRGMVLFMSLVILLVMTVLGIFSMNIARTETHMAGNSQFQTTALANAEFVLSTAEQAVEDLLGSPPFTDWNETGDEFYDRTNESRDVIDTTTPSWSFNYKAVDSANRYVVEYGGSEVIPGNDASMEGASSCTPGNCVWLFLTTAQSETSRGSRRTVQSVFVTSLPP